MSSSTRQSCASTTEYIRLKTRQGSPIGNRPSSAYSTHLPTPHFTPLLCSCFPRGILPVVCAHLTPQTMARKTLAHRLRDQTMPIIILNQLLGSEPKENFYSKNIHDSIECSGQKRNRAVVDRRASRSVYKCIHCTVLYPYWDERRDIRSNIPLRLKGFPRAKPEGTPEGEWVYLTVYPESSPNTDSISFKHSLG